MKFAVRFTVIALGFAFLLGCGGPRHQVESDARRFVSQTVGTNVQVTLLDVGPGEGDASNVYYIVRLRLTSATTQVVTAGLFAGLSLRAKTPSSPITLEMLYQYQRSEWSLVNVNVHLNGA